MVKDREIKQGDCCIVEDKGSFFFFLRERMVLYNHSTESNAEEAR